MELLSTYKIEYIQFEIRKNDGEITFYRRGINYNHWEEMMGESWELIYDIDELENIYQKWNNKKDL